MWIFTGASLMCSAWMSVFTAMNSTWLMPASIIRLTAFSPAPPTPTTLITARYAPASRTGARWSRAGCSGSGSTYCSADGDRADRRRGRRHGAGAAPHGSAAAGRERASARAAPDPASAARASGRAGASAAQARASPRASPPPSSGRGRPCARPARSPARRARRRGGIAGRRRLALGLALRSLRRAEELRERAFTHAGATTRH